MSLRDKARKKRARGHLRRALRLYEELCVEHPNDGEAWRERGEVELELGRGEGKLAKNNDGTTEENIWESPKRPVALQSVTKRLSSTHETHHYHSVVVYDGLHLPRWRPS